MPIHHVFFKPITDLCYFNFWLQIQSQSYCIQIHFDFDLQIKKQDRTHNIVSDSRGGDIFPVEKVHKESKYIGDHSLQKMIGCHVTFVSPPPSSLSQCSISSLTKSKIGCMQEEKGRKKEIVVCVRKSRLFQGPHSSLFFRPR